VARQVRAWQGKKTPSFQKGSRRGAIAIPEIVEELGVSLKRIVDAKLREDIVVKTPGC
jgi:hypothetical protein